MARFVIRIALMKLVELCPKCSSLNTHLTHSGARTSVGMLTVFGYRSLYCNNCGFSWNQFLPMNALLNLIYLLLAIEIGFLLLNYIH